MPPQQDPGGPLAGSIAPGVIPGVLRRLYRQRRSGMLALASGGETCRLWFCQGQVGWGNTSIAECQLGPVLLKHGLMAPEPLDQVVDLMGRGKRLGEVLLELGALDREILDEALILHAREILLPPLGWPDGTWRFEDQPVAFFRGYDQALRIDTVDLILDAAWCVEDPDVVRFHLGDLERRPVLAADPARPLATLQLTPVDHVLLSFVNGSRRAREVLARVPGDPLQAQRSLFGLLCGGLLELLEAEEAPAPPVEEAPPSVDEVLRVHAALPTRDHFEVLGLLHRATAQDVVQAAARLVQRFDHRRDPEALAGVRPQLEAIVARVLEAARVLGNPKRREGYERALAVAEVKARLLDSSAPDPAATPSAPPPAAEDADMMAPYEALAGAEAEFAEGRYWDALQVVEVLLDGLKGRLRLRALLLRARIYARNANWRHEAEEQLKEIVAADPATHAAFFLLGELYEDAGLEARAAAMFRRVLALRPRHPEALARLGDDQG
jgi:tetratricopeptide (TPR) repeat protein